MRALKSSVNKMSGLQLLKFWFENVLHIAATKSCQMSDLWPLPLSQSSEPVALLTDKSTSFSSWQGSSWNRTKSNQATCVTRVTLMGQPKVNVNDTALDTNCDESPCPPIQHCLQVSSSSPSSSSSIHHHSSPRTLLITLLTFDPVCFVWSSFYELTKKPLCSEKTWVCG